MNEQTLVAVYDTSEHADAAVRDLKTANVPADAISQHVKSGSNSANMGTTAAYPCANRASGAAYSVASLITIPQCTTAASKAVRPS
jgi:hypothetical protein